MPRSPEEEKAKTGTKVSYRLSLAASTKFTVERVQKGRKKGKKCVAPKRSNKKGKKCTRYVMVQGQLQACGQGREEHVPLLRPGRRASG